MTRWLGAIGLIFSLVGLVSQGTTSAQTPQLAETRARDDNLAGIDSVRILVEELNQDAARCGLSDDVVRLAAAGGFLKGDVTVSEADEPVTAAIRIDTVVLENTNECASDYRVSLMALAEAAPASSVEPVLGLLTVKQAGGVLFSARGDHRARLTLALSETAKDLATKIRLANQPATRDDGCTRCARATRRERLLDRAMSGITGLAKACAARDAGSRSSRVEVPRAC